MRDWGLAGYGSVVLNLADYWRLGNVPKLNPQHPTGKIVAEWPYNPPEPEE